MQPYHDSVRSFPLTAHRTPHRQPSRANYESNYLLLSSFFLLLSSFGARFFVLCHQKLRPNRFSFCFVFMCVIIFALVISQTTASFVNAENGLPAPHTHTHTHSSIVDSQAQNKPTKIVRLKEIA